MEQILGTKIALVAALLLALVAVLASPAVAQEAAPVKVVTTKTYSPQPAVAGQPLTFTVTGSNQGTGEGGSVIMDAYLHDQLPSGFTFVSATVYDKYGNEMPNACQYITSIPNEYPNGVVQCAVIGANLALGESVTMTVTVIPAENGVYENVAWTGWNTNPPNVVSDYSQNYTYVPVYVGQLPPPPTPTTKAQCKKGGFAAFGFADQGSCIAYVKAYRGA